MSVLPFKVHETLLALWPFAATVSAEKCTSHIKWTPHKVNFWLGISKKYFIEKVECSNRSLRKVGKHMSLRAFKTQLGKTLYNMVCMHSSPFPVMGLRLETSWGPFLRFYLSDSVVILWIHLSSKLPSLEVTFLPTGKENNLQDNALSVGTVGALSGVNISWVHILCTWVSPCTDIPVHTRQWPEAVFKPGGSPRPKHPSFNLEFNERVKQILVYCLAQYTQEGEKLFRIVCSLQLGAMG